MKKLTRKLQEQFDKMCATGKLFRSSVAGQQLWDLYINGFENDPVFRDPESSTHNCNLCKNFLRRYGNIVAVDSDYSITTIFDVENCGDYQPSMDALSTALKTAPIADAFFETFDELKSLPYEKCTARNETFKLGVDTNFKRYTEEEANKFGVVKPNEIREFNHLHLYLPKLFVQMGSSSIESIMSRYRDAKNVFKRALDEITVDTLHLVKDLISQDSLLDGKTHLHKIETFIPFMEEYKNVPTDKRDIWCWVKSYNLPIAKFKNELIGVLCSELAEGEELNKACQAWNKRVDPVNYMKATAPITKKQIEEAKKFVEENGYEGSFNRRSATIDDIKASEIKHINVGDGSIKSLSVFDDVKPTSTRHKRSEFEGIEEVGIEKFMTDILPGCTSVEAFLNNSHERNMVSLTTSFSNNSKPIFKWSNNYSWTYRGNLAGKSEIKENVKSVGGKIEGVLRCSLQWNDKDTKGIVDFDLHCEESNGAHIYYSNKKSHKSGGWLDVDMIRPSGIGIENITWQNKLPTGEYKFYVRNFDSGRNTGFKAEIEFDGEVYNYYKSGNVLGSVKIATVTAKNGVMSIVHDLKEENSSKELWNLDTNQFHKVNLMCLSPNHWDNNNIGNKHYFFMLEGCKCPDEIRSFHNENLKGDLLEHRKVMEVLGEKTKITPADNQLSGLGFNATVRDELIVRLKGSFKRVIKIKF